MRSTLRSAYVTDGAARGRTLDHARSTIASEGSHRDLRGGNHALVILILIALVPRDRHGALVITEHERDHDHDHDHEVLNE